MGRVRECLWTLAVRAVRGVDDTPGGLAAIRRDVRSVRRLLLPADGPRWACGSTRRTHQDSLAWLWFGFLLVLSPLLALFEGDAVWAVCRQIRALEYPTTRGTMTGSEVEFEAGGSASSWLLRVRYKYRVGETDFTGTRYRYDVAEQGFARSGTLHEIVKSLPPGKRLVGHYSPTNPADALLKAGTDGFDLFSFLFLTPFDLVWIFCCIAFARTWRVDRSDLPGEEQTSASASWSGMRSQGASKSGGGRWNVGRDWNVNWSSPRIHQSLSRRRRFTPVSQWPSCSGCCAADLRSLVLGYLHGG